MGTHLLLQQRDKLPRVYQQHLFHCIYLPLDDLNDVEKKKIYIIIHLFLFKEQEIGTGQKIFFIQYVLCRLFIERLASVLSHFQFAQRCLS